MSDVQRQARAFTYARQRLGRSAGDPMQALRAVIGVYSAHPTGPLSLLARCQRLGADAFRSLEVLRLPAMRQTIHLLPADTAHLAFHAAPAARATILEQVEHEGIDSARYEQLRAAVLDLTHEPASARQLRAALGTSERLGPVLAAMTREGDIMRVGAHGLRSNELLYVRADIAWADADEALAWLAGEYLRAFGPVRPEDFIWWTGATAARARAALAAHDTVDVGEDLLLDARDLAEFEAATVPAGAVDLLPKWDCYTMGYPAGGRKRIAGADAVGQLYDDRGDGLPVVLIDGEGAGTWGVRPGGGLDFEVSLFDSPGPAVRRALDERAADVRALLSD